MKNIKTLSKQPNHHFYGYYDINPWSSDMKYHLALETNFNDKRPEPDDIAKVGLIEKSTGMFIKYAQTSAFNFQQGSMLQWINVGFGEEFTYNDWEDNKLVSRAINIKTKKTRTIDGAIAAVSKTKPVALGLSFDRMFTCRKVVGYSNIKTDYKQYPDDDGIFLIDLVAGKKKLILTIADVIKQSKVGLALGGMCWFNHLVINPSGDKIVFLTRLTTDDENKDFLDSMWTVNMDGSNLQCQIDYGYRISHFTWIDDNSILVSTNILEDTMQFVEYTVGQKDFKPYGNGLLPSDGHACFSSDKKYLVCDTYPSATKRLSELLLYDTVNKKKISIGKFYSELIYTGDIRCDLHPRWSICGKYISFDSVHENTRQIYLVEI